MSAPVFTGVVGGRYELVQKIAEGGMGAVYRARHTLSKKVVALKVIVSQEAHDEITRQRFLREVAAPAQIGHRGIVEIYDAGFDPTTGALFVAMEMLEGQTLRALLESTRLPRERVMSIFLRLLEPLAAAHAAGFVHRDLKPENVFLATNDGTEQVKLLDFGIARHLRTDEESVTATGIAIGTPHYMSPEQAASAKDVSFSTDVWAVGVMLYEALGGVPPFRGDTLASLVVDVLTRPQRPLEEVVPGLPLPIARVVDHALDKQAAQRPRDAGALLAELRHAIDLAKDAPPAPEAVPSTTSLPTLPQGITKVAPAQHATPSAYGPSTEPSLPVLSPPTTTQPAWGGVGNATSAPTHREGAGAPTHREGAGAPTIAEPRPSGTRTALFVVVGLAIGGTGLLSLISLAAAAFWWFGRGTTEVRHGSLDLGDPLLPTLLIYDVHDVPLSAGDRLTLDVTTSGFDPRLTVHSPTGRSFDDDPGLPGAHLELAIDETGTYQVLVSGSRFGDLGAYDLTIRH